MLATSEGDTHSRAWEILATLKARPFTEDFRGPGAKGVLGHLLPSKLLHIFYHEGSTMPSRLPQDLGATKSASRNTALSLRVSEKKGCLF